jgi:hypothetical protein
MFLLDPANLNEGNQKSQAWDEPKQVRLSAQRRDRSGSVFHEANHQCEAAAGTCPKLLKIGLENIHSLMNESLIGANL